MNSIDVVGRLGTIVTRIRGAQSPGEVAVNVGGTISTFIAHSPTPIERFTVVTVTAWRGGRNVDVIATERLNPQA